MRPGSNVASVVVAALLLAVPVLSGALRAQPAGQPRPSTPAPFKRVAITLPEPLKDPSFEAFRKELSAIAAKKDRAALGRLVVGKGFFWERERGNGADSNKSGYANLAAAIGLDLPDDPEAGWDTLSIYADDPTVFSLSDRPGVVCGPADPGFNEDDFQAMLEATRTDVSDWVYPVAGEVRLYAAPRADASAAEKTGLNFLRVLASDAPADQAGAADFIRVLLPSGKSGFVRIVDIASLGVGQMCYLKEAGAWKIAGVLGGGDQ